MKLRPTPYSLLFMLLLILGSCSKKTSIPVPVDAAIVFHIDGKSLLSKLSWEEFKQGELYKAATETLMDDSLGRKILENPENSGVDIQSDAFVFVKPQGRGGYSVFTCNVKDEKIFTDFITKAARGKEIKKQEGLSVVQLDDKVLLTWNNRRFVIIGDTPDINKSGRGMNGGGYGNHSFPTDSLFKFANEVYSISGSKSIGSDKRFDNLMKQTGDGHIWVNVGSLYDNSLPGPLAMLKTSLLLEGNASATTFNFDNGKITVNTKSYLNKDLTALIKKYKARNLDENMLKGIPVDNVIGAIAITYPPEGLKEFLTLLGVDGFLNAALAQLGYSIDDFVKATKGDLLFAYAEPTNQANVDSSNPGKFSGKFLFATSVKDKASFQKLITSLEEKLKDAGPNAQAMVSQVPYQLKDNWFVAGNDAATVNNFGTGSMNHPFISKISGHPVGGFVDIQKIIMRYRPSMKDSSRAVILDASSRFWQDIVFHGGEFKDDAVVSDMEINLVDKNTNSLKQLNSYLGTIAKTLHEKKKMETSEDMSAIAPPIPVN